MKKTPINVNKKPPSFRLAGCGDFPDYRLGGISLKKKNILYLVSVGTKKFEDKWVKRLANFAKEIKPQKVLIIVADSLQRFNIEIEENLSEAEAFQESIKRGQQWVQKYNPYFSNLEVAYEFIFWEKLKEDKDYQEYFKEIMEWNELETFNQLLLESAEAYINRFDRILHENRAIEQSIKFLNEESAVIRVLAKNTNTIGIFYPGAPLKIFNYIIEFANKSRTEKPFFYAKLIPTKENKSKDNKSNPLKELPFFQCRELPFETHENKNGPIPLKPLTLGL